MNKEEIAHILVAVLVFTAVLSFGQLLDGNYNYLLISFGSVAVVLTGSIVGKKIVANFLDSDVTHRIWFSNYFIAKRLDKPLPTGIILPLFLTLLSSGFLKMTSILEYETSAKKIRAAKRFGYYSYAEMTDWHNALIGAGGMILTLIVMILAYSFNFEHAAKASALYMFWNMIPISNSDGTQIYFGSKILWTILAIISVLSTLYAVALI